MKKILLAAMVAAVLGAAQAVTVNWSAKQDVVGGASGTLPASVSPTDFTVAMVFTITSQPSVNSNILTLSFGGSDNGAVPFNLMMGTNTDGTLKLKIRNDSYDLTGNGTALAMGKHVVAFFVQGDSSGKITQNVQISIDGGAYSGVQSYSKQSGTLWDSVAWSGAALPEGVSDAWVTFAEGKVDPTALAELPEPTALALLALGVAGLALRRRVA